MSAVFSRQRDLYVLNQWLATPATTSGKDSADKSGKTPGKKRVAPPKKICGHVRENSENILGRARENVRENVRGNFVDHISNTTNPRQFSRPSPEIVLTFSRRIPGSFPRPQLDSRSHVPRRSDARLKLDIVECCRLQTSPAWPPCRDSATFRDAKEQTNHKSVAVFPDRPARGDKWAGWVWVQGSNEWAHPG